MTLIDNTLPKSSADSTGQDQGTSGGKQEPSGAANAGTTAGADDSEACEEMVTENRCVPQDKRGQQRRCAHPALPNGYCKIHQPIVKLRRLRKKIARLKFELSDLVEEERRLTNVEHVSG